MSTQENAAPPPLGQANAYSIKNALFKVWAVSPLILGGITIFILLMAYDQNGRGVSLFNAHSWPVMKYAVTNEYTFLHIMLVSNVVVIIWGTFVYISEIARGLRPAEKGWLLIFIALICGGVGVVVSIIWIVVYISTNVLSLYGGGDVSAITWEFVKFNDKFVLGVFALFLLGDILLTIGYAKDLEKCKVNGDAARAKNWAEKRRFAIDSIWFVDVPVIAGSVLLLILLGTEFSATEFAQMAPYALDVLRNANIESGEQIHMISSLNVQTFVAGFFLGSIICQLAYSQIVFTALNFRLSHD